MSGWANSFDGSAYESYDFDTPFVYCCEEPNCETYGNLRDDGDMDRCADCDAVFCPEHRVPDKAGRVEICLNCRAERDEVRDVS